MRPDPFFDCQLPCAVALMTFVYKPNINAGLVGVYAEFFAAIILALTIAFAAMPNYGRGAGGGNAPCCFAVFVHIITNEIIRHTYPGWHLIVSTET